MGVFHKKLKNDFFTLKLVMPFINTYNSRNIVSEIYNNQFYKTYVYKVYGYGNNKHGKLGISSHDIIVYNPQKVLIEEKIKVIKIYDNRTYFITINGEVYACGGNKYGQLGVGSYDKVVHVPHKVLLEEKIKDIKIYKYNQTYFITVNDMAYACGNNEYGQLGIGSYEYYYMRTPQKVLIEEKIKDIKIHVDQTYFITINNEVYACGVNVYGQLGIGSHNKVVCIPQKVLIEEKIKNIKLYMNRTYFITINDELYACGNGEYGQLGIGSDSEFVCIPQKVLIEEKIKDITLKYGQIYFITINGKVYACGINKYGQLGIGSHTKYVHVPQKVLLEEKIKDIKDDWDQTYFITFDNKVYACGNNNYGQLGIGSRNKVACIPQKVLIEEKIKDIKIHEDQTYFITINNEVYACGDNNVGQLGIGSCNKVACIPQKVLIEEKIKDIKCYCYYTYFISIYDEVYGCGKNEYGQFVNGLHNKVVCIPQKIKK